MGIEGRADGPTMSTVRVEKDGPVTTVVLARPDRRNAVDRAIAQELSAAFRAFDADNDAAVGVLWGAGGTFCAGADLQAIAAGDPNRLEPDGDGPMGPSRMQLSKPVIAAISGYAVAGGLELALWCDLRVVEDDATLGVFCRRWGVPLIDGGNVRLPQVVGLGRALDLILTGRAVSAQEAFDIGLANRVVKHGEARPAAEELARQIAAFPQACVRSDRQAVYAGLGRTVGDAMRTEFELGVSVLDESDAGVAKFASGAGRGGAGV
jgi:enoyl-CoA hydratase